MNDVNDMHPLTKALGHLLWPHEMRAAAGLPPRRNDWLATTRWVVTVITVLSTVAQLVVWLMICVIGREIESPWWLWSTVPGIALIGLLSWMLATRDQLGVEPAVAHPVEDDAPLPSRLV